MSLRDKSLGEQAETIYRYAQSILDSLSTSGIYDNNSYTYSVGRTYKGYGFSICETEKHGIREITTGVSITLEEGYYSDSGEVFTRYLGDNTNATFCITDGDWLEAFEELYKKRDVIADKRREEYAKIYRAKINVNKIIDCINRIPLGSDKRICDYHSTVKYINAIDDNLCIIRIPYRDDSTWETSRYRVSFTVMYNGQKVFFDDLEAVNYGHIASFNSDHEKLVYEPGIWEDKIKAYSIECEEEKQRKKREIAQKNIQILKDLK